MAFSDLYVFVVLLETTVAIDQGVPTTDRFSVVRIHPLEVFPLVPFSFVRFCSVPRKKNVPTDVGRRAIVMAEESYRSAVTRSYTAARMAKGTEKNLNYDCSSDIQTSERGEGEARSH